MPLPRLRPVLIPMVERLGRKTLRDRGLATSFIDTPLGHVHVFDGRGGGTLPPVVLLHGLGSNGAAFTPVIAHLQRHVRRIVAPDYPGHGFSPEARREVQPAALFDAMVHALDDRLHEPAIVVGNSLGGAVALHYAITRPERVAGLVLLSPAGAQSTDAEWRSIVQAFDIKSRAEANAFLDRLYHRVPVLARVLAHELGDAMASRRAVREILANASPEGAHDQAALGALRMPVLLVWGQAERLLPDSHFAYYRRHLPTHAVAERPQLGHVPQGEAPRWVAERIVKFGEALRPG